MHDSIKFINSALTKGNIADKDLLFLVLPHLHHDAA